MSWPAVRAGLHEVLEGLPGVKVVTTSVPPAVDDWPFGYFVIKDTTYKTSAGSMLQCRYHAIFRVVFPWQDQQAAEDMLAPFVNSVPEAVVRRVQLAGRLPNGNVQCTGSNVVFVGIGGVQWLGLDFDIYAQDNYDVTQLTQ